MSSPAPRQPDPRATLARRLGTRQAVHIGLGSMVGAGLFSAFAPAAAAAGSALLLALAVAALVAWCNATSSAQLAAQYPTSGGTYVYGRERLGHTWGFLAGWGFVIGKTASCAAMAMTMAAYVAPADGQRPLAVLAVMGLTAVNLRGVTRTAQAARAIVTVVVALVAGIVILLVVRALGRGGIGVPGVDLDGADPAGLLQGAALLFFAFAGYARIATLGEEVIDPVRTIPRSILLAFGLVVPLYAVVGWILLLTLGSGALAHSTAPLLDAVDVVGGGDLARAAVIIAAALAALGALLGLLAGVGRTSLAMARHGDLPRGLAAVHPRHRVPHVAEAVVGTVVCVLVVVADLRGVIGFSSFGVLTYYAVANASALTQTAEHRLYPRGLAVVGLIGCLALAFSLSAPTVLGGAAVLAAGVMGRAVVTRARATPGSAPHG